MRPDLAKPSRGRIVPPDSIRGPTDGQANFSFSEDTYGTRTAKPRGFARADTASVTQLASLQLSINNAPRHPLRDRPGAILLLAASRPVSRHTPPLGVAAQTPVVEVNGIEPMTSCLQSRRSPN